MNIRATLSAVALAAFGLSSVPAHAAACTDTFDLGSMGPPAFTFLFNSFGYGAPSHFDDCYNFTLDSSADSLGLTWEWDWSSTKDIDLTSVSLTGGGLAETRPAAGLFSFSGLLDGSYQLVVSGDITSTGDRSSWWDYGVGYKGVLATTRSAQVPEPQTLALVALGLAVAGWSARRGPRKS